jgi:NAD(P)-dependent dehydrogenase (short-subunit alcohol dehydrogenase family)
MRLHGKKILITGGAAGIGEAGVLLFVEQGASVAIVDRDRQSLDDIVCKGRALGGPVEALVADLADPEESRRVVREAASVLGGLDVIWCNAGVAGPAEIDGLSTEAYELTIAVNQTSVVMSCTEALPYLRKSGRGSIIITSSISGIVGALSSPTYSASKFAVVGWAKSLAQRVAPDAIRVNAICPGPCMTPLMKAAIKDGAGGLSGPEYFQRLTSGVPLGRLADPIEIAHAALWLASDESSFVTGVALPVDGGYTCR